MDRARRLRKVAPFGRPRPRPPHSRCRVGGWRSDIGADAAAARKGLPHGREAVGVEGLQAAQVDGQFEVFLADGLVVDPVAPVPDLLLLLLLGLLQEKRGRLIVGAAGADRPAAGVLLVGGGVVEGGPVGQGHIAVAVERRDVGVRGKVWFVPVVFGLILLAAVILGEKGKNRQPGVRIDTSIPTPGASNPFSDWK